jgi:hypothetical protein
VASGAVSRPAASAERMHAVTVADIHTYQVIVGDAPVLCLVWPGAAHRGLGGDGQVLPA